MENPCVCLLRTYLIETQLTFLNMFLPTFLSLVVVHDPPIFLKQFPKLIKEQFYQNWCWEIEVDFILQFLLIVMIGGKDDKGSYYPSINEMWEMELNNKKAKGGKVIDPVGSEENWYNKANSYWMSAQASYNGVLGGFANLSSTDIAGSFKFVFSYFKTHPEHTRNRVIDCGAGIGRIAKELLCQIYKKVDLIDQCEKYIEKAKQILKDKNVQHFYAKGLQQFNFEEKYDCVWIQWVISHLTDQDAVKFLIKARAALNENGFIMLKENDCKGFIVDKQDYSVTRSKELFLMLFAKAGLKVVQEQLQPNWPQQMFKVRMYLLQ